MPSEKKVALITGANRGIGFETARQLGQQNVIVIVAARTFDSAQQAAEKLTSENIEAYPIALDVHNEDDRKAAAKVVAEKFGRLDILVNNAGIDGARGILNPHTIQTPDLALQNEFRTTALSLIPV